MATDQGFHCARSCFSVMCPPALEEVQWQLSWACSCARSCFSTQMLSSLSIPGDVAAPMVDTRGAAAWRTHEPAAYRQEEMHGDGSTLGYSGFGSAMLLHTTMELFLTQMQADDFRQVSVKHMATYRCSTKYITNVEEGSWVLVLLLVLASGKSEELLDRGMMENKLNLKICRSNAMVPSPMYAERRWMQYPTKHEEIMQLAISATEEAHGDGDHI